MFVKVCGLRTEADIAVAAAAGADAVGLVLGDSVRRVSRDEARRLVAATPPTVLTVGVFGGVAAAEAAWIAQEVGVAAVQLHGAYLLSDFAQLASLPVRLIRATTLTADTDVTVGAYGEDLLLLDSPVGGSGERWDLTSLAGRRPAGPWLLAGGLTLDNVAGAIAIAHPWGVDVSSGVEASRGVKDHGRIRAFVAAARSGAGEQPLPPRVATLHPNLLEAEPRR